MELKDFPNYFQAADSISIKSQKSYLNIIRIDLISMIIAALLAIYSFQDVSQKFWVYSFTGLFLLIGLILTIVLKSKKYEDIWYQGRALAESSKTLTWRFVTCAEYFEQGLNINTAKERFIQRIREVSNEFKDLSKSMDSKILNQEIITSKMVELRNLSMYERKSYYIKNRIEDQQGWYSKKAEWNKVRYNFWFWVIIASQFLALISIVVLMNNPESNWNVVGLLTTIASSAISWLQIKQHQEQKQAYTTASEELNFIKQLSYNVSTEEELSEFILDSENAISREHTLWLAQRRK
ncbi:DUF4231 domain-containing protein [Aestuariibaculum sediminum]|uniref:DUF4231 domain-containing protein n=1 Tax=Aestuariibaculum sediminum TaxID=2770637 RepID=A0A8J6U9L8_9FLAO|nr:DUF4231 domain-containing protein [Aestuariibaculum sediminum]MBD0833342.1 DUF4231 domain-containing protein [Aestuariibaculum sediminum]